MKKLILAIAFLLFASTAHATLIERDFLSAGDALLTYDTDTKLEWLDVNQSINISYDTIVNQFGVGGNFEGFRHANTS